MTEGQLDLFGDTPAAPDAAPPAAVVFTRSARARNYRLTLRRDGVAVATIPARGSERAARAFVAGQQAWLERARARWQQRPQAAQVWTVGTHVPWRGRLVEIRPTGTEARPAVALDDEVFRVARRDTDLKPTLEAHFQRRAKIELPARTWELAARAGFEVQRVTVRNQRTRWGSCTSGGTISLNWRLVQAPDAVRDYIILHELTHLKEMNHGPRFWARLAEACPGWREAEQWLDENGPLLGL